MTDTDQKIDEDEVLKRMLATPPTPHDKAKKNKRHSRPIESGREKP